MAENGIARRIREARERNQWTQAQVEAWADLPAGVVAQFEAGARTPNAASLAKLARGLRVTSDWLLGLEPAERAS